MTLTPKQALVADALIDYIGGMGLKIRNHDELIDYIVMAKQIHQPPPTAARPLIVSAQEQSNERRTSTGAQRQNSQREKGSPGHV